jgi:hypothetical protein
MIDSPPSLGEEPGRPGKFLKQIFDKRIDAKVAL